MCVIENQQHALLVAMLLFFHDKGAAYCAEHVQVGGFKSFSFLIYGWI